MAERQTAQYKQIENDLLQKINLGYYKKDDLIPTELELSNTYHVSRVTVRKATDNLVAKGLLTRVAGVGTFVCHPAVTLNPSSIQGFSEAGHHGSHRGSYLHGAKISFQHCFHPWDRDRRTNLLH